jgi:alpha-beta hydrolase superfamily lysophospholipase
MRSIAIALALAACGRGGTGTGDDNTGGDAMSPPSGLGVGVTTRTYVDTSRPTPANGLADPKPSRTLVTEIWYPAPAGTAGPETMTAPLASGGPFPLVVFVHGSLSNRRQSTFLTQALAAAGYVVLAADFPLTADSTDGGSSDLHVEDETGDIKFLVDQAAAFAADATDALHGAIDPQAGYIVIGHSTGGSVTLLMAFGDNHDPRVRAAVAISGDSCFFADGFFQARSVPLLVLTGSRDLLVPPPDNARRTYDLAGSPKVFASIVGGFHMGFTDWNIADSVLGLPPTGATDDLAVTLNHYGNGAACVVPAPSSDADIDFDAQHGLTTKMITAYLERTIRGLDTPYPNAPALVVEHSP